MDDFSVALRWSDIDSLRHVNNVRYLQFADEARAAFAGPDASPLPAGAFTLDVLFARPLPMSAGRAVVVSRVEGDVLTQDICAGEGDDRVVYASIATHERIADALPELPAGSASSFVPWEIRHGDMAVDGRISSATLIALFQEGRMEIVDAATTVHSDETCVVARTRVDVHRRPSWRAEPFEIQASVGRIGTASFTIEATLMDGHEVLARCQSVLVGFDVATQRSRPLTPRERATLETYLSHPHP